MYSKTNKRKNTAQPYINILLQIFNKTHPQANNNLWYMIKSWFAIKKNRTTFINDTD